jgi:hypothetical protein
MDLFYRYDFFIFLFYVVVVTGSHQQSDFICDSWFGFVVDVVILIMLLSMVVAVEIDHLFFQLRILGSEQLFPSQSGNDCYVYWRCTSL